MRAPQRNPSSRAGRWLAREDGFAGTVILSIGMVMFLLLALQVFLWYSAQNIAQSAAQSAYSLARAHDASSGAGEAIAYQFLDSMNGYLSNARVSVDRGAEDVSITVTGDAASLIPGLSLPPVSVTVEGPIERWVPAQ